MLGRFNGSQYTRGKSNINNRWLSVDRLWTDFVLALKELLSEGKLSDCKNSIADYLGGFGQRLFYQHGGVVRDTPQFQQAIDSKIIPSETENQYFTPVIMTRFWVAFWRMINQTLWHVSLVKNNEPCTCQSNY